MSINIRSKRFALGVNEILRDELKKGNLPTSKEFGARLNRFLREQDLGKPEYTFRRALNGELATADFYNTAVEKIQKDLMLLYENTIAVHDELKSKFSWFEVEKNRLEYESRKLEAELKEKILLYGKTGYLASVFDTFDDLSKIEREVNLAIDTKAHQVSLANQENTSFQITPKHESEFVVPKFSRSTFKRIPVSGELAHIFNARANETYQEVLLAKTEGEADAYLDIAFEKRHVLNRIDISVHTIKDVQVALEFTNDDLNYFHLPYNENAKTTSNKVSFQFPSTEMKRLRIWLRKQESDRESVHPEGFNYQYLFGLKSVHFYQLSYPEEGYFETKTLSPNTDEAFSIGKVSLVTEEEIPDGTDIEYYVRVGDREEDWRAISPVNRETATAPKLLDFKHVVHATPTALGIQAGASIQEAEAMELQANGISFYAIGAIEKRKVIPRTERLYMGKDAWGVQETVNDLGESRVPRMEDWRTPPNPVRRRVQNIEDGNRGVLLQKAVFSEHTQLHYSMGIYSEGKEKVLQTIPSSTEPIGIYLNGEKLFEGIPSAQTHVNYRFRQGWNDVTVLIYTHSLEKECTVDLGFDPMTVSTHCYASSAFMEKVSLFDLRYNTKNNDWSKYALYEKDGRVYIVVNHSLPGITYDFYYDYTDENERREIELKAVLKQFSVGSYTTPVLRRYTLQFS